MCAEYNVETKRKAIEEALKEKIRNDFERDEWSLHVRISTEAPIVVMKEGEPTVAPYRFSLKPPGVPYPTFNARLSSWDEKKKAIVPIYAKPTWKTPLERGRCIVPMTAFIEPVYLGERAGTAQQFQPTDGQLLLAAGLSEQGVDKKTGEVYEGFAPILHTPSDYILNIGHHRLLVFLKPDDAREWLHGEPMKPEQAYKFLLERRFIPELTAEKSRSLAKNWEKKVDECREKVERERAYIKKLEAAGQA